MGCCIGCCYKCCCHHDQKYLAEGDFGKGKHDKESAVMKLPDGRLLAYMSRGADTGGGTVIFCHGFPGTRMEVQSTQMDAQLERYGMRMITVRGQGRAVGGWRVVFNESLCCVDN
jgi:hypothetical protein